MEKIDRLQQIADLEKKLATALPAHSHVISDTTGLQTALDGKSDVSHTHSAANITDFNTAADARVTAGIATHEAASDPHPQYLTAAEGDAAYADAAHGHAISDTTGLQTALDGKAAASHTHPSSQISDSTAAGRSMLTAADAAAQTALLNNATTALKGLVPAPGAALGNFLKDDLTWAAPSGGGSSLTRINGSSGAAGVDITCQKLSADAATNSTTTLATVMTTTSVGAGTWHFKYAVIYQSAATTTGVDFAVNHTGTVTKMVASSSFPTTGGAAANGIADQVGSNTASLSEGKGARAINTKFGSSLGVDTANANCLMIIEGVIVVSATGSLELKHASEVAAASTVKAESSLILTKVG